MTDDEANLFWQYSKKDPKLHIAIGFALWRGLRVGEIGAINIDDFKNSSDLSRMNIVLEKSHIMDSFPLLKDFIVELQSYIQSNLHLFKSGYLFSYYSSHRLPHWSQNTMDVLLGRLRSQIGVDHPQVLDYTDRITMKYRILKIISNGHKDPKIIHKYFGGHHDTLRKTIDRLYNQDFIDMDSELTVKGLEYVSIPRYIRRYRISWHSMRRWFETRIWGKYKDTMLIRDMMRYSSSKVVDVYISPYETWCREHELMKDVFADKYKEFERMSHGQVRLNQFSE
jgi:hypothetical protein